MSRTIQSPRHEALRTLLIACRKKAGLTQAQVAAALGRPQSYVATVEQGQRRVDVVTLLDLSDAIGFDASELLKQVKSTPKD
jgi:transcriptional regulator with XRE-family HTH domain